MLLNQEYIDQWLKSNPPYKLPDLIQSFLEIHKERGAQGENTYFKNLPIYFSLFLDKKYQAEEERKTQERKAEKARKAQEWYAEEGRNEQARQAKELHKAQEQAAERQVIFDYFRVALPFPSLTSPAEKVIDSYLMIFFSNAEEREIFKETIIFPLAKRDKELGFKNNLASYHNVSLLTRTQNPVNLSGMLEKLANVLKMLFPIQDIPQDYQSILEISFLPQLIADKKLSHTPITENSAFILFAQYYMDDLLNEIEEAGRKLCSTRAISTLSQSTKEIKRKLQPGWDVLLDSHSAYYFGIPIAGLDLQLSMMKTVIRQDIINSPSFRYAGWLQIFCFFLNVLLFFPLFFVFLPRIFLNLWDEEKHPNICFIPDTPFIRIVREKRSKITNFQERISHNQPNPAGISDLNRFQYQSSLQNKDTQHESKLIPR